MRDEGLERRCDGSYLPLFGTLGTDRLDSELAKKEVGRGFDESRGTRRSPRDFFLSGEDNRTDLG